MARPIGEDFVGGYVSATHRDYCIATYEIACRMEAATETRASWLETPEGESESRL